MGQSLNDGVTNRLTELGQAGRTVEAKRNAEKDADHEAREARRSRETAEKNLGKAIRALRIQLDLTSLEVARRAFGYFDPTKTHLEYVALEDGCEFNQTRADEAIAWLTTNAGKSR